MGKKQMTYFADWLADNPQGEHDDNEPLDLEAMTPEPFTPEDDGPAWLVRKAPGQPWRMWRLAAPPVVCRAWRLTDGTIVAVNYTLPCALRSAYILRGKHAGK